MVTLTGFKNLKSFLSRTQTQNVGDTGLIPLVYWNGPFRATPMSMVILSPSGMAPGGISRRKSLCLS